MASRKKALQPEQLGFEIAIVTPPSVPILEVTPVGFDLEDLDDHLEDPAHATLEDAPAPRASVFVECVGKDFEVCKLHENGTAYAKVVYSRSELRDLVRLATEAMGDSK